MINLLSIRIIIGLAVILCLILNFGCKNDPEQVVFMAGFRAQANLQFVAAYVAKEKGYFSQQGLNVDIKHASTGEHLKLLLSGDVDFTTAAATSVLKRRSSPGLPVVAFALFGQQSQQAYVALKDSGINSPKDWEGRKFGYKISVPPDYLAILEQNEVDRSKIDEIKVGFDPRILIQGKVDVLAVFNSNEPDTIRNLGFDVNTWESDDYGVPNLGLTYIATQDMLDSNPQMIERFLKASIKAVEYIKNNREETLDIVMKYAPDQNREHQQFMLNTELNDSENELTLKHGVGWMSDNQWYDLYEMLIKFEALPERFDYKTAFTTKFLGEIYSDGSLIWP